MMDQYEIKAYAMLCDYNHHDNFIVLNLYNCKFDVIEPVLFIVAEMTPYANVAFDKTYIYSFIPRQNMQNIEHQCMCGINKHTCV